MKKAIRWTVFFFPEHRPLARGIVIVVLLLGIELLGVTDQKIPFVYFQF